MRNLPVSGYTNQITLILESVARGIGFTVISRYARRAFAIQVVENGAKVVDTLCCCIAPNGTVGSGRAPA